MHPPHSVEAQFIEAGVTGIAIGKNVNTQVIASQTIATMLMGKPALPRFQGPIFNGWFVALRHARRAIGIA